MVFSAAGEQKLDFRTHNTAWEAVDFDGIKLMRRPLSVDASEGTQLKAGFSKAANYRRARTERKEKKAADQNYTIIDLETTGLKAESDEIIEYGALRIRDGKPAETFSTLVHVDRTVPANITELTGISNADLMQGMEPSQALRAFLEFVGKDVLLGQYISFDMDFLRKNCEKWELPFLTNKCIDLSKLARKKRCRMENYKLLTMMQHFGISDTLMHRALADCDCIYQVYCKLNETAIG